MGVDWPGEFFVEVAVICFRFSANLESKLVLRVLAFGVGEGFEEREDLEVEEGELLRVSSFFGSFLL
jgi:hypothetical protein